MDIHYRTTALNLLSQLEDFFYNHNFEDVDLLNEELKIVTPFGVFQFNYHGVSGQIWYSSPVSGAHHFALINNEWVSTRIGESIWDRIKKDFNLV